MQALAPLAVEAAKEQAYRSLDIPQAQPSEYRCAQASTMPRISRFLGITVVMHYDDHPPPHFHVRYGDDRATMEIDTMRVTSGSLPPRVLGLVTEWGVRHRLLLRETFQRVINHQAPHDVPPLE